MQRDLVGAKDPYATEGDVTPLPFTHGIEVEYLVTTNKGQTFGHGAFEKAYQMLINDRLKRDIEARIPDFYKKKVKELSIAQSSGSSYEALFLKYETRHGVIESEIISVDRNVAEWPLVEAATPPCETLYELAWWSASIQALVSSAVRATGLGASILACGTSPMEDIQKIVSGESFATCGEHHHLAVYAPGQEAGFTKFYHLLRAFIPSLLLMTSDSTFASGKPSGRIRLNDPDVPFPRCVNTLRVMNNRKHLCDFHDGEYIPYLAKGWKGKDNFIEEFQKQSGSFRKDSHFLDIDPLSRAGTTEIRIFDSQPSVSRRVGVAAILQMIAHSAFNYLGTDPQPVLDLPSRDLFNLKRLACDSGPWAKPTRASMFNPPVKRLKKTGVEKELLSDLALEMGWYLHKSGVQMGVINSRFLYPVRHTIYSAGGKGMCLSQHWLLKFAKNGGQMQAIISEMMSAVEKSANLWYDPIVYDPVRFPIPDKDAVQQELQPMKEGQDDSGP